MTKRVLVLVEGQTEERFVKSVLAPAYEDRELYFFPTLLVTKRVKDGPNFKGGVTKFAKFRDDAARLLADSGDALVTTVIDYYGLPLDFPGMDTRPNGSPLERVRHVQDAVHKHFKSPKRFLPFLALHEFEAWLFASTNVLPSVMTSRDKEGQFAAIRAQFSTPEAINEQPNSAPSKRIEQLFPGYKKVLHGPITALRIGLTKIAQREIIEPTI